MSGRGALVRRALLACVLAGVALPGATARAAEAWPARPIRFVVPFPPGNAGDLMGRMIAEKLTASLGQPVLVDNRPGAGGNIGTEQVARAAADGYTVLIGASGIFMANPFLYKLAFDPSRDLTPVTLIYSGAPLLVVSPKVTAKTLHELLEAARRAPGKFSYASYGAGHISHLLGEMFGQAAGISLLHVPYRNSPLPDVMSGQVDMIFESPLLVSKNLEKLRPLAVVSTARNPKLPDVPAVAEALPGFELTGWLGAFVPSGTPGDIVGRLHREITAAIGSPDFRKRLDELWLDPGGNSPEAFARYVRTAAERVGKVIREAGIKLE